MNSKVSHLSSRKVGKTLGNKLNELKAMMNEFKTLLEAQRQPIEEQSLIDFEDEEDTHLIAQDDQNPVPELVRVDSASSMRARTSIPEYVLEQCVDSDEVQPSQRHGTDQAGDDLVLQYAQETLSQATSLYEESLYEGSSGNVSASDRAPERQRSVRKHSRAVRNSVRDHQNQIEILEIPEREYLETAGRSMVGGIELDKRRSNKTQISSTVQILPVLTDEPLNIPSQLESSFRKLQDHFRQHGSSTLPVQLTPKLWSPVTTLPRRGKSCGGQRRSSNKLTSANKASRQQVVPNEGMHAIAGTQHASVSTVEQHPIINTVVAQQGPQIPLRYLHHIQQKLEDVSNSGISHSREPLIQVLLAGGSRLLPTHRVALIGRLGIGKSYIAAAYIHRLVQRFETVSIFWISVPHIEEDCKALSELLHLKCPEPAINPWNWLRKIIARLPRIITEPWLIAVDGVNIDFADDIGLQKLLDDQTPKDGYVLMTTRHHSTANGFLHGGLSIKVDLLDGEDAGNLISSKSLVPRDFEFDMIASALDFDPFVAIQVSSFLEQTGMPLEEFSIKVELVLNDQNWAREGEATIAAKAMNRKHWANDTSDPRIERFSYSELVPVLRAILNPSWLILFDTLDRKQPAAAELLSILSVLGRRQIPEPLLTANAGDKAATGVLVDQCFLTQTAGEGFACRLMLIAHRVWLLERDEIGAAYQEALKKVSNEYPAVKDDTTQDRCESLEPFAEQILCDTARSWIPNDRTSEMYIEMLKEKRKNSEQGQG